MDPETLQWTESRADAYPSELTATRSVPYEETFLLVGGHRGSYPADRVYKFDPESGEFRLMPERLRVAKHMGTAFHVQHMEFPDCF